MESGKNRALKARRRRSRDAASLRVVRTARSGKKSTLDQNGLNERLPPPLRHLLTDKNPHNIKQTKYRREGFETITWQDDDGSRLFLKNPDPARFSQELQEALQSVLYADSDNDTAIAGFVPGTILVQTNDDTNSRLAAQKMVRNLGKELDNPNTVYVAKELSGINDPQINQANNKSATIAYTLIPKQATPLLIDNVIFQDHMGGPPKDDKTFLGINRTQSKHYKAIVGALENFHQTLSRNDQEVFGIEHVNQESAQALVDLKAQIDKAAADLLDAADDYISNSRTNKLSPAKRREKETKIAVVKRLKEQTQGAIDDGFKTQLDRARTNRWKQFKPLNETKIVPGTGQVIGSGAQGDVTAHTFRLADKEIRFAVKLDDNQLNADAIDAGIPPDNPQQSVRAVAAYALSKRLGLGIIPRTKFMQAVSAVGRPQLGQALAFVEGTVGQREGWAFVDPERTNAQNQKVNEFRIEQLNAIRVKEVAAVNNGDGEGQAVLSQNQKDLRAKYEYRDGDPNQVGWFEKKPLPVDIDYDSGAVQKGLSDLQLFDVIIGHADRNAGNWIYERNAAGVIVGIKGIDNDDAFGKDWKKQEPGLNGVSKTPDVPPVIDIETAVKIIELNADTLNAELKSLSGEEQDAAVTRLLHAQEEIKKRIQRSEPEYMIASNAIPPDANALAKLKAHAGMNVNPVVIGWNAADLAVVNAHSAENSYLGQLKERSQREGLAPVN